MARSLLGPNGVKKIFSLISTRLFDKKVYKVNMDTPNLEGGLDVIEKTGIMYITAKVRYKKDISSWSGAKIGIIENWLGLEIQFEICGVGDNNGFQNTVCLIQSNGEIWLTPHGAITGLNWFYGSIAVVI